MKRVLTIAGSDSGGGAGIQADIKTISAIGCYAASAITAVTAQNTLGVVAVEALSPEIVEQQIRAVLDDIGADAVKIGMLANTEIVELVASLMREYSTRSTIRVSSFSKASLSKAGETPRTTCAFSVFPILLITNWTITLPSSPFFRACGGYCKF